MKVDLSGERIHKDFLQEVSYGTYLRLPDILNAQSPRTDAHDELMFITVHQISELWLKLILHEASAALALVREGVLEPCFKMLSRVTKIQNQLEEIWTVASTMTPADYGRFRAALGHASGFQSYQYRILEFTLGNKNAETLDVHQHDPEVMAQLEAALRAPSFYDEVLRLLAARGFEIPQEKLERDWSVPYQPDENVRMAWQKVYADTDQHWELYELAEKLLDIEENFQRWRFRHLKIAERIIGFKRGTGGTSGVAYLAKALELRFFPELWTVRTQF